MSKSECNSGSQPAHYLAPQKEDLDLFRTTYGLSIKQRIDNIEAPEQKVAALRALTQEAKAEVLDESKNLTDKLENLEAEKHRAVAKQLKDEKSIQELEMIIQADTGRTTKIKEGIEKLVASLCPTEAEAEAETVKRIQELKMMMKAEMDRAHKRIEGIEKAADFVGLLMEAEAETGRRIQEVKMMAQTDMEKARTIIEELERRVDFMGLLIEAEGETEVEQRIQNLVMMLIAERERALKIIEGSKEMVASMPLTDEPESVDEAEVETGKRVKISLDIK